MWIYSRLQNRTSNRASPSRARHRLAAPTLRAQLEALENRTVFSAGLTTLAVTSLADSGRGTLRDAIQTADKHAGKPCEIDISVPGTILLESSLPDLTNAITIKGLGTSQTLIQRDTLAAAFRILTVDSGQTASLSNLGIAQGNAGTGAGGAIDNFGNLTLVSCAFSANTADQAGAVANEAGARLTVTGVSFTTNHASDNTANRGGGAIWNNGSLTVQGNSSFDGNTASRDAGAILNLATTVVAQATFTNNSAVQGGAIDNDREANLTVSSNTSFTNNSAVEDGGAIFNTGTLGINGASFNHNTADLNGGAIDNFFRTATVTQTSFTNNTTAGAGGAIENSGALTVSGCNIENNTAEYGGAINGSRGTLTLSGCTIEENSAGTGGAFSNFGGELTLSGSIIKFNTANVGGGIFTQTGGTTSILNCTVIFNSPDDTDTDAGATLIVSNSFIGVQT